MFDYTWLNDCSYYLFHSDESRYDDEFFYITAHFKVFHVSPQTSFIESINISVAGHNYTIIKGEAFLNGIHVSLPYKSEKINIKEIEGTKGTILAVLWNGVSATTELFKTFTGFLAEKIDIGITAEFIYKTKGLYTLKLKHITC